MNTTCPSCGHEYGSPYDPEDPLAADGCCWCGRSQKRSGKDPFTAQSERIAARHARENQHSRFLESLGTLKPR